MFALHTYLIGQTLHSWVKIKWNKEHKLWSKPIAYFSQIDQTGLATTPLPPSNMASSREQIDTAVASIEFRPSKA